LSRKNFYLLTAFGKDRPGIVAGVTRVLYELGANIEDASMTRLGGEFTMMLITALPASVSAAKLEKGMQALQKKLGIQTSAKAIPSAIGAHAMGESPKYLISVYGTDHPGIVYRVVDALAKRKVSITDLQTKVTGGAKPVYVMLLEIQVPSSTDMDDLRTELDQLRQDLKVEISLQDIEAISL
jgi:glycine cleavage system transcriptional repressor